MRSALPWKRWALLLALALGLWLAYQQLNLGHWFTLDQLNMHRDALTALYAAHPIQTVLAFFGIYVLAAALSIPGALFLTLAAGAMFGLGLGLLVASFASSLGALLAFWSARYLLRATMQARFGKLLGPVNAGLARDGTFYLLALRLVPVFPFWLINLLMGLTSISWKRYYLVSQAGMLAGTTVYANAGTHLASIETTADILSPELLGSLALLGVFPLLARFALRALQRRKR